jgi:hypothetical protein
LRKKLFKLQIAQYVLEYVSKSKSNPNIFGGSAQAEQIFNRAPQTKATAKALEQVRLGHIWATIYGCCEGCSYFSTWFPPLHLSVAVLGGCAACLSVRLSSLLGDLD